MQSKSAPEERQSKSSEKSQVTWTNETEHPKDIAETKELGRSRVERSRQKE
jgi:hypothetical protein